MSKKLKTKACPEGRNWPDTITLDVGSNMPFDVYGVRDSDFGVLYIRHDIADAKAESKGVCEWHDEDGDHWYLTQCHRNYRKDQSFKHCPGCGKEIKVV